MYSVNNFIRENPRANRRFNEVVQWDYKARETMNEIFPDNFIQNRSLMRHLGISLTSLERIDEAYSSLKIYIKLTKITRSFIATIGKAIKLNLPSYFLENSRTIGTL